MLTTSVDGLWVLQVFTGIEKVCPELGLRPHNTRAESPRIAQTHPVVTELIDMGAVHITPDGPHVDKPVYEWLTVLSRREVGLIIVVQQPANAVGAADLPSRVMLARFGKWWVSLAVFEEDREVEVNGVKRRVKVPVSVSIKPMGTAGDTAAATKLVRREIESLCGTNDAAKFKPLTVASDRLRNCKSARQVEQLMIESGADVDQLRAGMSLSSAPESVQASIVAIQQGQKPKPTVTDHVVTVGDTTLGRVMVKNVTRNHRQWTILAPGNDAVINSAISELLLTLPSGADWNSIRNPFG